MHRFIHSVADGHRNPRDPNILLVHTVGQPHIAIGRQTVAFRDAAHIVHTVVFEIAFVAARRGFSFDQEHVIKVNAVITGDHCQRPTMIAFGIRIIHKGKAVI